MWISSGQTPSDIFHLRPAACCRPFLPPWSRSQRNDGPHRASVTSAGPASLPCQLQHLLRSICSSAVRLKCSGVWKHEEWMIWPEMFNPALHSWLKSFTVRRALMCGQMDLHVSQTDGFFSPLEQMLKKMRSFNSKSTCQKMADILPKTTTSS